MSDLPLEQPVPPAPSESKPITINSDLLNEDAFAPSAEQQAAKEKLDRRSALALPIINKVIPVRTIDQYEHSVARYTYMADKPEDVRKAEAARRMQNESSERASLAYRIAQTEIPEAELEDYITTIYGIAQDISPNNSGVEIGDINGLAYKIENTEQSHIFKKYAEEWKQKFLTGVDDETVDQRMNDISDIFTRFSGAGTYPKPDSRSEKEMDELFQVVIQGYETAYSLPNNENEREIVQQLTSGVMRVGLDRRDATQAERALRIGKQVAENPDRVLVGKFMDTVNRYGIHHEITEEAVSGLSDKLFTAMEKQDPQVSILLQGGNIWGMYDNDFGAADFLVHCYALKVTPQNLSELLLAAREAPSTVLVVMEKNRKDAGSISRSSVSLDFSMLREIVHDQRPGAHELLNTLTNYYDTNVAPGNFDSLLQATGYFKGEDSGKDLLKRELYEKPILDTDRQTPTGEKVIDVIRRLAQNTEPVLDEAPVTSDPKLNEAMQRLIENSAAGPIPKEVLGQVLDYANSSLLEIMQSGEIGIDPNYIQALSWLERRAFETMRNLTYEDQSQAYRQDWFVSILKFQELIGSPHDFDESAFQSFITKLQSSTSDRQAYQLIGTRALESIYQLAKIQSDRGRKDTGGLWSGNLPHELIGLVDPRPAETEVGRRARNEDIKRATEPGYHPGD
jgi:hypothetical protein